MCSLRRSLATGLTMIAGLLLAVGLVACGDGRVAVAPGLPWGATEFPNVPLITQEGRAVRFYDDLLKDKIVLISFMSTSCMDACRFEIHKLAQVQELLGDRVGQDVFIYSITNDPVRDTPAALKEFAAKRHLGPGWLFLTGQKGDIDRLCTRLGLCGEMTPAAPNVHPVGFVYGDEAAGRWMRATPRENTQYLATAIGDTLNAWTDARPGTHGVEVPKLRLAERGRRLFESRCALCHTLGAGDQDGPDLQGVTGRRGRGWLARWLSDPDRLLAEQDPVATALFAKFLDTPMPNLHLGKSEVEALLAYFEAAGSLREPKQVP